MAHPRERLIQATNLRAATSAAGKVIGGRAIVYNQKSQVLGGWFEEVILPGALTEAIATSDVRCLFNHDANQLLGRTANKTLVLNDTPAALEVECTLPDTAAAADVYTLIARGDVSQMSFAFTVAEERWTFSENWPDVPDLREVLKIAELYDVSPVTYPAYPQTEAWARSMSEQYRDLHRQHRERRSGLSLVRVAVELAELELELDD